MTIVDETDKVSDMKKWNEINIGDYIIANPTNYEKKVKITNPDNNAVHIKQKEFLLKMLQMQLQFLTSIKNLSENYKIEEIKKDNSLKQTFDNYKLYLATFE